MWNSVNGDPDKVVQARDVTGNIYINSQVVNTSASALPGGRLRVLAVDDEPHALDLLVMMLRADTRISTVEAFEDATTAVKRLVSAGPPIDGVFLDLRMPGLDGWELARLLARFAHPPAIVFVTAHMTRAVEAFDLEVVDYLLKPVAPDRLGRTIDRVARMTSPAPEEVVAVDVGGGITTVPVSEVFLAEAQDEKSRLHTKRCVFSVDLSLATIERTWDGFIRINRRHLVAVQHVERVRDDDGQMTVRVGGHTLHVSRQRNSEVRAALVRSSWSSNS